MDLLHLVDRLEELVATAQKMPIGSRAMVDRRRLLDIVDQMRIAIPQEVREAQEMVDHRDELHREAEEEARLIVARAEQRAQRLVDEHEITSAARARAEEIARHTEARLQERIEEANSDIQERLADSRLVAEEQMNAADEYARELLQRLSLQLRAFTRSVDAGIAQLEPAGRRRQPAARDYDANYDEDDDAPAYVDAEDEEHELPRRPTMEYEPENLLRRGPASARAGYDEQSVPAGVAHGSGAVIDDFEYPELDDDPSNPGRP